MPTLLDAARPLAELGFCLVPVPFGKKEANLKDWPNLRLMPDDLPNYFNGAPQNIAVHVGEPSGHLADIDIDADILLPIAHAILPPTEAIFGRHRRPHSHRLYIIEREVLLKFLDPIKEQSDDEAERKGATLVEIRAKHGHLTIVPPSEHSGDVVRWDSQGEPSHTSADDLIARVKLLAAIGLFARYWPDGARHDASLALFGALLRAGWTEEKAHDFVEAICISAQDEEGRKRLRNGRTTARKLEEGEEVTGWPTLAKILDQRIIDRACEWLEIKSDARTKAHHQAWSNPVPLPDDLLPVPRFDVQLLPAAIRDWIADIAERMQCPVEFPAVAALVAAAALIGNRLRVRPKREDDWTVVPNLWGAVVAKPGSLKTPALDATLKPLKARERIAQSEFKAAMEDYEFRQMQADAQKKQVADDIRKAVKEGRDGSEHKTRFNQISADIPIEKRYVVNDPTIEKLGELLNQNECGLMLFRDELVGFLRSLDREGREQDRTFYLETWAGSGSYTYDRIGRGTLRIENLTLSILGGIQPGPLTQYLRSALSSGHGDDGLMQRFQLIVYPDPPTSWRNVDRAPDAEAASMAHECFARLDALDADDAAALTTITAEGTAISFLRFDEAAQNFFDEWRADLEAELLSESGEHDALKGHLAKFRSLMPSLALIFHLMDRVSVITDASAITLDAAQRAAAWCSLLEAHAKRTYGLALNAEISLAKSILVRLQRGDLEMEFTPRDIYRKHWAGLSKPSDVTEPLRILEDHGWLRSYPVGGGEAGGRTSIGYLAHPSLEGGVRQ